MNIFVDTEFSSLGSDPRLISIALVAEDGSELYIEFKSGWSVEQCSPWVRSHVLLHLGANGEKLDRRAVVGRIESWLGQFSGTVWLIVDSSWDKDLITQLYAESGSTPGSTIRVIPFADKSEAAAFEVLRKGYFLENEGKQHHALHDARALRFSVSQSALKIAT